jgi:phosphoribosylglycinamide formyltransferase-1
LKKIAILASGSGTNAENLIKYFNQQSAAGRVVFVLTNNPDAGVINRCKKLAVSVFVMSNTEFENPVNVLQLLQKNEIDLLVLAGFLRKINPQLIEAFPDKIINIHPALLPAYGGKGMYGNKVHEAVISHAAHESGITIHYVNDRYDEGKIIFQAACPLEKGETVVSLAEKIHQLEHLHFPKVLEQLLLNTSN